MPFRITAKDARERLEGLKISLETLELFTHEAGFRDSSQRIYDARLRVSEALDALPKESEER